MSSVMAAEVAMWIDVVQVHVYQLQTKAPSVMTSLRPNTFYKPSEFELLKVVTTCPFGSVTMKYSAHDGLRKGKEGK